MPLKNIEQAEIINITPSLRLRKYDGQHSFALSWYQDLELVWLVDGDRIPYDSLLLSKMFTYLNEEGECYFIEVKTGEIFQPIGDVTLCPHDLPIVIGEKSYQGKGIGKQVLTALIERAKQLHFTCLEVEEIFEWNTNSQKLFTGLGFVKNQQTKNGYSYLLPLSNG